MPLSQTYPNAFGGVSRVAIESGVLIERIQGYAVLPTTPTASLQFTDISTGLPMAITASGIGFKTFLGCYGQVFGSPAILSAAGTLKVADLLTRDFTNNSATVGGVIRDIVTGVTTPATTVPVGAVIQPSIPPGHASSPVAGSNVFLLGASNETGASTAINFSSASAARPCVVMVTIAMCMRPLTRQSLNDYPLLPRTIKELLQVSSLIQ